MGGGGMGSAAAYHLADRGLDVLGLERYDVPACPFTNTPDSRFVIDAHPDHPQVTVAAGFSGHGFKFSSVVGSVLADLAIEGATDHPVDAFGIDRFALDAFDSDRFDRR